MIATRPVQFGIIGAGRIARNAIAPAIAGAHNAELAAAASRDVERARAMSPRRAYASYDALLDDADIEAVFIATHNGLHRDLAIAALARGKHVLCEKPLACDARQCAEMVAAARQHKRLLAEAFMYRHHACMADARRLIAEGTIGELRTVEATFSFLLEKPDDVRWNAAWGGGSLLDVGCYCVNACRFFFDALPAAVTAMGRFHPEHGVDVALHGVLQFSDSRFGVISCGFDGGRRNKMIACGTHGTLTLPVGFGVNQLPVSLLFDVRGERREIQYEPADVYRAQIEQFACAVRGATPLLPAEDGWRNALVMDALLESARRGGARCVVCE